jgi:hypothetical protein
MKAPVRQSTRRVGSPELGGATIQNNYEQQKNAARLPLQARPRPLSYRNFTKGAIDFLTLNHSLK